MASPIMRTCREVPRHSGFSLVEIMVGIGIAMIAALVMMQVFAVFEGQKRTTSAGADAQINGRIALYALERDVRMAGYGLNLLNALGCTVNSSYNGTASSFILAPIIITNGAGGGPDTIRVLASAKQNWSVPSRITTDHPPEATNMFLNTTQGMAVNDFLIAYQEGKPCTLLQLTGIPNGNVQIHHQNTSPWNPPGGQNIFPQPDGYTAGALVFDIGALVDHTYSLDAGDNLLQSNFSLASNSAETLPLASNIVSLQAQYGFDTRAGAQEDGRADTWSDTMIDADGNGTPGDGGDIRRIYALRLALVARSAARERPNADGNCTITTATSANRPKWSAGDIDVSKKPDGSARADWSCYRYKVFETVVPLRNLLWGER
ncbi:PilW family protein [Noviherbaspirillum sp. UKPF54]|uniref:PilW family protein n=1 Tax=Noviherbaspirillum sp. UKPF54 TaxID=2601898 RepID=UPI00143D973B|nr:PilW family protein [Noviherbaspirillum sp. UKPF54]